MTSHDHYNFQCIGVASVDFIKKPLIDILASCIKPRDLFNEIKSSQSLMGGKKLRLDQRNICFFCPPLLPDYKKFDVSLLYTLIRNLCPSLKPRKGWGKLPDAADTGIGDDIERLRLFRNNFYAHASSAVINDKEFDNIWKDLNSVIKRIQSQFGHRVNYEQELIEIKNSKFTKEHLEVCRVLLEASMKLDCKDDPEIIIKGESEVICGDKAKFKAVIKQLEHLCWSVEWQKRRGENIKCIDISLEKYSGSSKEKLVIPSVRKEDEGEYKALLTRDSNGNKYTLYSNAIYLHVQGELPVLGSLCVTTEDENIIILYTFGVPKNSPAIDIVTWGRIGQGLSTNSHIKEGYQSHQFIITSPSEKDSGKYTCTVQNAVGSVSKDVVLDVPEVHISVNPTVKFGSKTTIKSVVKSTPQPDKLEWQKSEDGKNFHPIDIKELKYLGSNLFPEYPLLVIPKSTFEDTRYYRLYVSNKIGKNVSNTVDLKVTGNFVKNKVYKDRGEKIKFTKLSSYLAKHFRPQDLEKLKSVLTVSDVVKNTTSLKEAKTAWDFLTILKDENLFTQNDVIFMQFLCTEIDCPHLFTKCLDYAANEEDPNTLCYFEKPAEQGYTNVEFHVQGNISSTRSQEVQNILETVAAMLDCKKEDIYVNGVRPSSSFILILSIKETDTWKLSEVNQENRQKLAKLKIDFLVVEEDTIHLESSKEGSEDSAYMMKSESEKSQEGNKHLLKLMSSPELRQSLTVPGVSCCYHISRMKSNQVWVSDKYNLTLTNTTGDTLQLLNGSCIDLDGGYGLHTVNSENELIFIDKKENVSKLSKDMKKTATFVNITGSLWRPRCVYWSPFTGDLLVGMYKEDTFTGIGRVTRYNKTGQMTQIIRHDKTKREIYSEPLYITENNNGDVVVSNRIINGSVEVTERGGRHRFSYTGLPSGSKLRPRGICTDALSHILVCDDDTHTLQIIDKDGQYLSHLSISPPGVFIPHSLFYDVNTHLLWVGSYKINRICVYSYIKQEDIQTGAPAHYPV